jgi:hypothetical protein
MELYGGTHPVVYCERGGHATLAVGGKAGIRHETWGQDAGALVTRPGQTPSPAGRLVNVGSKTSPLNGQVFIRYSGLWGSPGTFFWTSGYWGPAYNETRMGADGFITAWGAAALDPQKAVNGEREFYPAAVSR